MASDDFRAANPDVFFLDPTDPRAIESFLRDQGVLIAGEAVVRSDRAGDGNMNCTVRVTTSERSLIVKQARPWIEKYPQFAAPWDRAAREAAFYRLVARQPEVAAMMPRLIHFDAATRVLVLEDLGAAKDYSGAYGGEAVDWDDVRALAGYLSALHRAFGPDDADSAAANREMRELNHGHVFAIPLAADNGLDLDDVTPGLAALARSAKADGDYCATVTRLGQEAYLTDGPCLLHGDFFLGSFIRTAAGPRVIDPEFAFFGRPEFDLGVLAAHLVLAGQPDHAIAALRAEYGPPPGFDDTLMLQLAGVEIMRRIIGYAQLPMVCDLARKQALLALSRSLVLDPSMPMPARERRATSSSESFDPGTGAPGL